MSLLYRFGRFVLKVAMLIWHKVEFTGLENIPQKSGYIACSNHRTDMDPVYLAWKLPQQLFFMAKIELFQIPVLGFLLHGLGAFPVERGKGDTGALDYAERTVREGHVLAMFPEGTRSRDGKLLRGKSGIAVIVGRTGADVLPVGVEYEEPPHFRSKVTVHYGKIIPGAELKIEDNNPTAIKEVSKRIMAEIAVLVHQDI